MQNDPLGEIYAAMDRAGLNTGTLTRGGESMTTIVSKLRSKLANEMKALIERREAKPPEIIEI